LLPDSQPIADVYAIGFQEIVDLNAVNVAMDGKSQKASQFWQEKLFLCLNRSGTKYTMVLTKHLVGILLCIFVKESLLPDLHDVRSTNVSCGVMGMIGNKGAVCIRLCLYDTTICFICSHLAAHRENVAGRNGDFKNISEKAIFEAEGALMADSDYFNRRPKYGDALNIDASYATIDQHDIVFWLGDLNYRIDEKVSLNEVFLKIEQGDLGFLRDRDQLNIERANQVPELKSIRKFRFYDLKND
jgi:phosphatidylinositol-bisphosphatase